LLLHSVKYSELNKILNILSFLHKETIAAYCKNRMGHTTTSCGQHTQSLVLNMALHTLPPKFKSISIWQKKT